MRALEILKSADVIAAEDTRHTAGLLVHFAIQKKLIAVHDHNERKAAAQLLKRLQAGENIALVTDAGTPGISDPGAIVVQLAADAGIRIVPIPGASAAITALSAAGIQAPGFTFVGFLPASGAQRRKVLTALKAQTVTLIFYEAPHRVIESVTDMAAILGAERRVTLARELTKTFETFHRCLLGEAVTYLQGDPNQQRGEFVILVEAAPVKEAGPVSEEAMHTLKILLAEIPLKQAVKLAAEITGAKKNALYEIALRLQSEQ